GCYARPSGPRGCRLRNARAIKWRNWLAGSIGILAGGYWKHLVVLVRAGQMHARTAYVGERGDRAPGDIVLNIQVPLLHVGPDGFVRQGNKLEGCCGRTGDAEKARVQAIVARRPTATGRRDRIRSAGGGSAFAV